MCKFSQLFNKWFSVDIETSFYLVLQAVQLHMPYRSWAPQGSLTSCLCQSYKKTPCHASPCPLSAFLCCEDNYYLFCSSEQLIVLLVVAQLSWPQKQVLFSFLFLQKIGLEVITALWTVGAEGAGRRWTGLTLSFSSYSAGLCLYKHFLFGIRNKNAEGFDF